MKGRGSVGDTGDTRGVDRTRHRRFSISNTQECGIAPGALLERARDGEKKKRGRWAQTPFTVGRTCRVAEGGTTGTGRVDVGKHSDTSPSISPRA